VLLSVPIDNINIDVGVVINDYHRHLRGEGGRVFIKELHDSHVGRACNHCNGSTIGMIHILHIMKGSHASRMVQLQKTDKYRMVGIPPSGRQSPDVRLTRIQ